MTILRNLEGCPKKRVLLVKLSTTNPTVSYRRIWEGRAEHLHVNVTGPSLASRIILSDLCFATSSLCPASYLDTMLQWWDYIGSKPLVFRAIWEVLHVVVHDHVRQQHLQLMIDEEATWAN